MNKNLKKIHLICNAHLDPVWLWRWDEGAAEAISTFRVAADFCDNYDGFVFNHNEAILYQWIEEYEPELFERIKKLVAEGKWHIMGGWYLQPDCNMPYGEGMIRQIARGRRWFYENLGVLPRVAVNVDSFGHSKGLVQIMKKTGYEGYLFCRPLREFLGKVINEWGYDDFVWRGYDGSEIMGHRNFGIYNSPFGKADKKLEYYLQERGQEPLGLLLWGIGNHGGGPSKIDLEKLSIAIEDLKDEYEIVHSTPEAFFEELKPHKNELPVIDTDLNPWAVGGYTTQGEVKRKFRKLESELFLTEKMLSMAKVCCGLTYPEREMEEAEETLLFAQFHDIIPGTLVPSALEESLYHIDKGLDLLNHAKTKAFFALTRGQKKAEEGEIPLLAFNPHPYPVEGIFSCEFHMNQTFSRKRFFIAPHLYQNGEEIPCQLEQEESQMPMQWRRKVVFRANLAPMQVTRFDCKMIEEPLREPPYMETQQGLFVFKNDRINVVINTKTGLMDSYQVDGTEFLEGNGFQPLVMEDDDHTIGTFVTSFREICGKFSLMNAAESSEFSGTYEKLIAPVHIIEDGPIRTIVEADFKWNNSQICLRYYLPKEGTKVEVEAIVHWNEKCKMLKLAVPLAMERPDYLGHVTYGYDSLPSDGAEVVSQRWIAAREGEKLLSIINDRIYGSCLEGNEIRMTLLRSPRYGCLAKGSARYALYNQGYVEHTDQGVHIFRFWLNAGEENELLGKMEREAMNHHEKPYFLSFFPSGNGEKPKDFLRLEGNKAVLTAVKPLEKENGFLIRIYNPSEFEEHAVLCMDFAERKEEISLKPFEVKTYCYNQEEDSWKETDMLENQYLFSDD